MSFPQELKNTFTSSEMMFIAENDLIEVISKVKTKEKLPLITTDLPKLRLMKSYKIPIWLAIILRKQNKITVTPPKWLNEKYFVNKYNEELENPSSFAKMPDKWLEISKIFLSYFSQDLLSNTSTGSSTISGSNSSLSAAVAANEPLLKAIQDLRELRLIKLRKGLNSLNELNLSFNDFSLMEINEFRPFICNVMTTLNNLDSTIAEEPVPGAAEYDEDEDDIRGDAESDNSDNDTYKLSGRNATNRYYSVTMTKNELDDNEKEDMSVTTGPVSTVDSDIEMDDLVNEFEL